MSPSSYGYTYLTSYGWTGTGTGLRNGAIDKPLAIPPKKNLSGVGKDRDEAFPFWDHLFAAASKAIKIKVSSDDEETCPSHTDPSVPLQRTTTGIISSRRPICGTPASTSGSTTPDVVGRPSLIATAKREAAKRNLYARFFRGPVLGPDDGAASHLALSSESTSIYTEHLGDRRDKTVEGPKKSKKRKSEGKAESKEERRERKRLKKERKAARAAKRAEKALAGQKERPDQKLREHWDSETQPEKDRATPHLEKARKWTRTSVAGSAENLERVEFTRKGMEEESVDREQDTTNAFKVGLTTKKKAKRNNTPSDS